MDASDINIPPVTSAMGLIPTQNSVLAGIPGLSQYNTYAIPGAQGITNNLVNNTGIPGFQQGAGTAGGMGMAAGLNQFGAGGSLYGAGGAVLGTGFDPQQALYNRTLQQVQDQTRAGKAAAGVATSPYGAGIEAQQTRDFNIDWQNAQLQRQLSALQGAGSAFGQASNLQSAAPGTFLQGSAIPYLTNQQIGQDQFRALQQMGQFGQGAATIPQQQIGDWMNFLGF